MTLRLLEPAQQELDEAVSWYAAQAPGLGDAFLVEVLRAFDLIERFPAAWHPLGTHTRRCRLARFPYGVIFARDNDDLLVLAVAHLHRRPGYWRDRLKERHP
jgi:toxin ParE2